MPCEVVYIKTVKLNGFSQKYGLWTCTKCLHIKFYVFGVKCSYNGFFEKALQKFKEVHVQGAMITCVSHLQVFDDSMSVSTNCLMVKRGRNSIQFKLALSQLVRKKLEFAYVPTSRSQRIMSIIHHEQLYDNVYSKITVNPKVKSNTHQTYQTFVELSEIRPGTVC